MSRKILNHKGKDIVYLDLRGIKDPQFIINEIKEHAEKVTATNNHVVTLLDMKEAVIDKDILNTAKELAKKYDHLEDKVAVYGINGVRKILLQSYNLTRKHKIVPFNTIEEAKDYLVS